MPNKSKILQQKWSAHPDDARMKICHTRAAAINSIKNKTPNIHNDADSHKILTILQKKGYAFLNSISLYGQRVTINGNNIFFEHRLPEEVKKFIGLKARKISEGLEENTLSLTMGNIRNEKPHTHHSHTLTGAILNLGAQWEINHGQFGQVENGHDCYIPRGLRHRSTPISNDEERFVWTLSNIISP